MDDEHRNRLQTIETLLLVLQGDTTVLLLKHQLVFAAVLAAALTGACLGFLVFNFNPAKLFMGDSGALFLGFDNVLRELLGPKPPKALIEAIDGAADGKRKLYAAAHRLDLN